MNTSKALLIAALSVGLTSCATHARPQGTRAPESAAPTSRPDRSTERPEADEHPAPTSGLLAPTEVVWSAATTALAGEPPESPVTLELMVTRRSLVEAPLTIDLVLPEGVTLVDGPEHVDMPNQPGVFPLTWVVAFDAIPQDDLVVNARTVGDGFGFAASPRYTFGRVTPALTMPPRTGPARTLGNTRLGPTIPVGPPVTTTP